MAPAPESLFARGFAADAETEAALRAGLSGHDVKVQRGRMAAALRTLAAEPAPKLVFVDFDGVADPESAARELVAVSAFGTALIAMGSTDTADLARTLLRFGIGDYLVKPVSAAAVRAASAAAMDDMPDRMYAGRVLAFSGSAGSGVSTLVAALARSIGAADRSALIVDLNPASGVLPTLLGAAPAGDLPALLAALDTAAPESAEESEAAPAVDLSINSELIDSICAPAGDGISLVACSPSGPLPESPSPASVCTLIRHLANRAHAVLVTGMLDPVARTEIMQQSDARVLLYEPTLASINAAVHTLALLGTEHPATLVQCHPRTRRSALSPAQIRYAFAERRPDVIIPFEPALHAAALGEARGGSPGKAYREALRQVAERTIEGTAPVAA